MSERDPSRLLIPFPLRVPRHPAGEPLPEASEQFSFQIRSCVDVPGRDDGLYACLPDSESATDWSWMALIGSTSGPSTGLYATETHLLFPQTVTLTNQGAPPTAITTGQQIYLSDTSDITHVRLMTKYAAGGIVGSYVTLYGEGLAGAPASSEVSLSLRVPLHIFLWFDSGWVALPAAFQGGAVSLFMVSVGGDGASDPEIRALSLLVRRDVLGVA